MTKIDSWGFPNPFDSKEIIIDNKCAISIHPFEGEISIQSFRCFQPKSGYGTELMKRIIALADEYQVNLTLSPEPLNTKVKIPQKKLMEFYKRFGFKGNKEYMTRKFTPHPIQ